MQPILPAPVQKEPQYSMPIHNIPTNPYLPWLLQHAMKLAFWNSPFLPAEPAGKSCWKRNNAMASPCESCCAAAHPNYDVSMVETHHVHKLDAPSGTAITLAEGILENLDRKQKWVMGTLTAPDGTVTGTTDCAPDELPVSAIREGEVPGIHTIKYESEADSIVITHDAKNRKGFALGAVLAAEYTAAHQGFLGMNDLFQF